MIVETYLYMVFISLGAFLRRYYCKMVFWAHFGHQKKGFMVLPALCFSIAHLKWEFLTAKYFTLVSDMSLLHYIQYQYYLWTLKDRMLKYPLFPFLGSIWGLPILDPKFKTFQINKFFPQRPNKNTFKRRKK